MKKIKILLLLLMLAVGMVNNGYTEEQGYEKLGDGLKHLSNSFAITNAVALLHAGTWNTAYIGKITDVKFGLGINGTLGASSILLNNQLNVLKNLENDLKNLDFSTIPGIALTIPFSIRLGGSDKIPMDFGLYFGYIPYDKLFVSSYKFTVDSLMLGFDTRYAVVGEDSDFAISVGLAYLYQKNNAKFNIGNLDIFEKDKDDTPVIINLSKVGMEFDFSTHTIGLRTQLSKTHLFNFLEVSLALEPFFTVSNFMAKASGDVTVKKNDKTWKYLDYIKDNNKITDADFLNKDGHIDFKHMPINGGLRLYFGYSIKLWIVYLDTNIGYEPFSSTILASSGVRIGL